MTFALMLQASYDSSSSYESYNRLGLTLSLGQVGNGQEPSSAGSQDLSKSSSHDPYRYTRSTSQPVRSPTEHSSSPAKRYYQLVRWPAGRTTAPTYSSKFGPRARLAHVRPAGQVYCAWQWDSCGPRDKKKIC